MKVLKKQGKTKFHIDAITSTNASGTVIRDSN